MSGQLKLTVTLHWRDHGSIQTQEMTCTDQPPHKLIPQLVQKLGLPSGDDASHTVFYRLRLDSEQGPALHSKELLSRQNVADGSTLWLVPELLTKESQLKRCLLRLPDGSEIVVSARGQGLTRTWLISFLHLHNPDGYARELEQFEQYHSPYRYVSDSRPHCYVRLSDQALGVSAPTAQTRHGISLQNHRVSREHARLVLVNSAVQLTDLGSTNGTFVKEDKRRLAPHAPELLASGDVFWIGQDVKLSVDVPQEITSPQERNQG
jgi:hypothetical protein